MTSDKSEIGASRKSTGRRRNDRSHQSILRATIELLGEVGYRGITIEGIAARAGVGKQTIYRWWPSRAAVVLEASVEAAADTAPDPDTGALDTDLRKFLTDSLRTLDGPSGQVLRGMAAEAQLDAEFRQQFVETFLLVRRAGLVAILSRATRRGELARDVDPEVLADMIYGLKWNRLLFGHAPLNEKLVSQVVSLVRHLG